MPSLRLQHAHAWDRSPKDAIALQKRLAPLVHEESLDLDALTTIGGLDVSVRGDQVRAAAVVLRLSDLAIVDQVIWEGPVVFPYVPGLLSFREMPAILPVLEQLGALPDVFMLDAHGRAHPRRFGLACHLGVLLDCPAFGVAKTRLVGQHGALGDDKGSTAVLVHKGEVVGEVVRTRTGVKPVFVSVGHRITLEDSVSLTLRLAVRYKLPEPTRLAHRLSYQGHL